MITRFLSSAILLLACAPLAAQASSMPSYSCVFTEPFVSVDSYPGGLHFDSPDQSEWVAKVSLKSAGAAEIIESNLASGKSLLLRIEKGEGSDGMSDYTRPYVGTLSGSVIGQDSIGACLKFPDGTTPRPVKNVAQTDVLNVRIKPNSKATIVNTMGPGSLVWAYPEDLVNGWAKVATPLYPKDGSGPVTVVTGWVNANFLGKTGER